MGQGDDGEEEIGIPDREMEVKIWNGFYIRTNEGFGK